MAKLLLGSVVGPQGPQGTPGVNGSQGPQGIPGPSEIAATTNVVGLTTGQLLYNNGGKVGSVEIVDNLLSVNPNKPLSANQGKVLKGLIDGNGSAIGQITTRGYTNSSIATDCDLAIQNGKYITSNGVNAPSAGTFTLDVTAENTASISQLAISTFGVSAGKAFTRYRLGGVWRAWEEMALVKNISNPNLLINGDFQIWQRGVSFGVIPANSYTADRWNNSGGSSLTEKTISGIKHITAPTSSGLLQIIEDFDGKLTE